MTARGGTTKGDRGRARRLISFLALCALAVTSCGDDSGSIDESSEPVDGLDIVVADPTDLQLEAGLGGTLVLDDRGCLVLESGGLEVWDLVWPAGTVSNGPDSITLADGRTLRIGDSIEGGGGYTTRRPPVDHRCLTPGEEWLLISTVR